MVLDGDTVTVVDATYLINVEAIVLDDSECVE